MRVCVLTFGVLAYLVFFAAFLYQIGFVSNLMVPKGIDAGTTAPLAMTIGVNVILLGLFAIQHTIMARLRFKTAWTRIIPPSLERSTFVLLSSLLLLLMNWLWIPLPETVWLVEGNGALALNLLCALGWLIVLVSTFLISHFDLFGLRQVWFHFQGKPYTHVPFKEGNAYRWIRHPMMLGFILAFWSAPHMTEGRLLFALVTTAYILIGTQIEERTLVAALGQDYREYKQRVPMLLPWPRATK